MRVLWAVVTYRHDYVRVTNLVRRALKSKSWNPIMAWQTGQAWQSLTHWESIGIIKRPVAGREYSGSQGVTLKHAGVWRGGGVKKQNHMGS